MRPFFLRPVPVPIKYVNAVLWVCMAAALGCVYLVTH